MSDLETFVSPILSPLILGHNAMRQFSELEVATISTWMVKNAMVVDFDRPAALLSQKPPFFSPQQRLKMKTLQELPHYTSIWLGRFIGSDVHSGLFRAKYQALGGKHFGNQESFLLTFTVREVALQMITLRRTRRRGPILPTACDPVLLWDRYLIPLWPNFDPPMPWPPPLHFTDQTLKILLDRWNKRFPLIEGS